MRKISLTGRFVTLLAITVAGCHAASSTGERSVKPGINDPYKNANVGEWTARFESESREIFKNRVSLADDLRLNPGDLVADVGAGTGFMTELFADRVGPNGMVYAVDITPEFLAHIRKRIREGGFANVETVLCKADSVELPPRSVNVVFVCDTYHHFEFPHSSVRSIYEALKPGGRLVVVDFKRVPGQSREWVLKHVRAGMATVKLEIMSAGFRSAIEEAGVPYLDENYRLTFIK